MMKARCKLRGARRGTILYEVLITLLVSVVVLTGAAHLIVFTGQQRRMMSQRLVATREVGNLMEDFMTHSWEELTTETLSQTSLSEACLQKLPDAELQVAVTQEEDAERAAKRISVEVSWGDAAGRRVAPVRLVAWMHPDREVQP